MREEKIVYYLKISGKERKKTPKNIALFGDRYCICTEVPLRSSTIKTMHLTAKHNRLNIKKKLQSRGRNGTERKKGGGNALTMMNVNVNECCYINKWGESSELNYNY